MIAAYVAVTVVAAIAYAYAAVLSFTHDKSVAEVAERLRVPVSCARVAELEVQLAGRDSRLEVAVVQLGRPCAWAELKPVSLIRP